MAKHRLIYMVICAVGLCFTNAALQAQETQLVFDDEIKVNAELEGNSQWTTEKTFSGKKSLLCKADKKINSFFLKFLDLLEIEETDKISCWIYLDPLDTPKGIMIKFESDTGLISGAYWEGRREVFNVSEDQPIYYIAELPEPGKWQNLEFLSEEAGIDRARIKKIEFINYGGKIYWDKMVLEKGEPFFSQEESEDEEEVTPLDGTD